MSKPQVLLTAPTFDYVDGAAPRLVLRGNWVVTALADVDRELRGNPFSAATGLADRVSKVLFSAAVLQQVEFWEVLHGPAAFVKASSLASFSEFVWFRFDLHRADGVCMSLPMHLRSL